jgi:restriction system protein
MARRNNSIFDVLANYPWWVNVILAIVVYILLKYLIPTMTFQNIFFNAFTKISPSFAPIIAGMILFVAALSAFSAWRKGQLFNRQKGIETIRNLSWDKFEELVGEAYRRKGYNVVETGGGGADGGVDLVLRKGGEKLLVQCKHWKMYKVGVKVIRELYGVVVAENATGGIVISSGTFTQEAIDFAKGRPLELFDGPALQKLIADMQKAPIKQQNKADDNVCPQCGAKMVLRIAKKGQNTGEKFWGCSAFPKCRETKPYNE